MPFYCLYVWFGQRIKIKHSCVEEQNKHPLEKDITKVVYNCPEIKRDEFFLIIYKVLFYICFSGCLKIRIGIFIYCCFLFIVFIRSKNELFFFSCTQDARKIHTCIIYRNDWLHVLKTWPMSHCTWCILQHLVSSKIHNDCLYVDWCTNLMFLYSYNMF